MHDSAKKQIITFADFVTTANDATTISKFLTILIDKLEKNSKRNLVPNIIVTDLSWALINAVMSSFNKCLPKQYLNWCFKILIENQHDINLLNAMRVRIYLCNSHFIKNIIKKLKGLNEKVCTKVIRKTFLYMTTLVQNSTCIKLINDHLKHIYNIFNNRILDESVLFSLSYLNNELNQRNLTSQKVDLERNPQQQERDNQFNKMQVFMGYDYDESIRETSPFKKY